MFKFDPAISHVNFPPIDLNIPARTTALGQNIAKYIEEQKKSLSPTKPPIIFIDLGNSDDQKEGFVEVRRRVTDALELAFRGRIWAAVMLGKIIFNEDDLEWVAVKEGDMTSKQYVKLEFKANTQ